MSDPLLAPPAARSQILAGVALGAVALTVLLIGRIEVSVFVAALCVAAYVDLRRLFGPLGHPVTFVLGAAGALALLWCGYSGRLQLMPSFGALLVLLLLVSSVLLNEAGVRFSVGMTTDIASTIASAAVVGALGAHLLLIRAMPHIGFRALLMFGLAVLLNDATSFVVGRMPGRRRLAPNISSTKTWEGAVAGFAVSVLIGFIAAFTLDPPFDLASGVLLGAGIGVLAPVGDLAFSAIKRSAGAKGSGTYFGPLGGALDVVDSILFVAPAFYWALRTIAL